MSKQMCIAPRRGTGSHKLTNKKDYNIERTRADSLVLRHPFLPCPMLYPPFFLLIFESISSCSMHSIILKLKPYCPDHLLLQSPYLYMLQSHEWWVRKRKAACYDHCMQKSNLDRCRILLQHVVNMHRAGTHLQVPVRSHSVRCFAPCCTTALALLARLNHAFLLKAPHKLLNSLHVTPFYDPVVIVKAFLAPQILIVKHASLEGSGEPYASMSNSVLSNSTS